MSNILAHLGAAQRIGFHLPCIGDLNLLCVWGATENKRNPGGLLLLQRTQSIEERGSTARWPSPQGRKRSMEHLTNILDSRVGENVTRLILSYCFGAQMGPRMLLEAWMLLTPRELGVPWQLQRTCRTAYRHKREQEIMSFGKKEKSANPSNLEFTGISPEKMHLKERFKRLAESLTIKVISCTKALCENW